MSINHLFGCVAVVPFIAGICGGTTMKILTSHPKRFENPDPGGRNSQNNLFGTSIGLSDRSDSIYVGAPKYSYGGGIYNCDVSGTDCQIVGGFKKYGEK